MGNPLSPLIANIFMAHFETTMALNEIFPRIWIRYVDDIFAIIKKSLLAAILHLLNSSEWSSIKFTCEEEKDQKLSFLDLTINRKDGDLFFGIFHKPTDTLRYITDSSDHPPQHKRAAFNSLVYRLVNLPLTIETYEDEKQHIYEAAIANGYKRSMVDRLIKRHKRKKTLLNSTTLEPAETTTKQIVVPYNTLTKNFKSCGTPFGIEFVYKSGPSLQSLLGSTKDKLDTNESSGVYQITCPDCSDTYIGQTRRTFISRLSEHQTGRFKSADSYQHRSSVAAHMAQQQHIFNTRENFKILHSTDNRFMLDALESIEIHRCKPLLNDKPPPIVSPLFSLLPSR